ncbi:MAG: hypothetical protein ABSD70_03825 [Terracidiphilus sp.]|jgi:hypothetical protein
MSEQESHLTEAAKPDQEEPRGPNLKLLYSLIALALAAAIAIAILIVLPFYRRTS